jgi:hypothetical protein
MFTQIQKCKKSTCYNGNSEKALLKLKNADNLNMIKLTVHKKMLIGTNILL